PQRRYATAAELILDLRRFLSGEPIMARVTGRLERAAKWARRRPARATLLAAGSLLGLGLLGAGLWVHLPSVGTELAVAHQLLEVARHQRAASWSEARTAVERAKARLGARGSATLRKRIGLAERELDLVARLAAIRFNQSRIDPQDHMLGQVVGTQTLAG